LDELRQKQELEGSDGGDGAGDAAMDSRIATPRK